MSNQFLPSAKISRVFAPSEIHTGGSSNKTLASAVVDQYINYTQWRQHDSDFMLFYNVELKVSLPEAVYAETISAPAKEAPCTGKILCTYQKRVQKPVIVVPVLPTLSPKEKQALENQKCNEISARCQMYMVTQGLPYQESLEFAKKDVLRKYAAQAQVTQTPAAAPESNQVSYEEVMFVDVEVTKVVGPFSAGARFDRMIFNVLTNEGIFYRKKEATNTTTCYVVYLPYTGSEEKAKLISVMTKEQSKLPSWFFDGIQ